MSILDQLERDLRVAAERTLVPPRRRSARKRRLRVTAIAAVLLLASATVALAASGVILTGAPVRPEEPLNPAIGEGVPAPGGSDLLALRTSDPDGGPPWGMRLVRTTRGELCVQIGRVQDGQLGVLGVGGAFKDDGRFHPIPPAALPRDVYHGHPFNEVANETTSCHLFNWAVAGGHIGVEPSAVANAAVWKQPNRNLRDIYYGMLGRQAVSVTYRVGHNVRTQPVLPSVGAYLIVTRMAHGQQAGYGSESLGTEGQLAPGAPLSRISYRIDGRLCERGSSEPPGTRSPIPDPCPEASYPHSRPQLHDLHRPLRVKLEIRHRRVIAVHLSFVAPYAVTSAREDYTIRVPTKCRIGPRAAISGGQESLAHDVKAGELIVRSMPNPLIASCDQRAATIEVLYGQDIGEKTLVGSVTIRRPPGVDPTPVSRPPTR